MDVSTTTIPKQPKLGDGSDSGSDDEDEEEALDALDDDASLDSFDEITGEMIAGGGGNKRQKVPTNRSSITWMLTRLRKEISDTNRGLFRAIELVRYAEKGPPKGPSNTANTQSLGPPGMPSGGNASISSTVKPDADAAQLPYDLASAILVRDAFVHKMAALRKIQERLLLFSAGKSFNLDAVERLCNYYGYRLGNMTPDEVKQHLADASGLQGKGRRGSNLTSTAKNNLPTGNTVSVVAAGGGVGGGGDSIASSLTNAGGGGKGINFSKSTKPGQSSHPNQEVEDDAQTKNSLMSDASRSIVSGVGNDPEINEEYTITQQVATWLHDRGVDLSRTHEHKDTFNPKAFRGLTVPVTITPLQVIIQEAVEPEGLDVAPKAVKEEGEWDEEEDIAALELWLAKQKALKPAGSESSSSEVVTEKTVPLVWPTKLKTKLRERVPHIALISPHGTGLGGEGFTRMYLPLPKHPPKDLMMLPCMVAYLPFQWQDPNAPPQLQDDKKMMNRVVLEGVDVAVTHNLAIRGSSHPLVNIKPKVSDRPKRADDDDDSDEEDGEGEGEGGSDEGSESQPPPPAAAVAEGSNMTSKERKKMKMGDNRSVASWYRRIEQMKERDERIYREGLYQYFHGAHETAALAAAMEKEALERAREQASAAMVTSPSLHLILNYPSSKLLES